MNITQLQEDYVARAVAECRANSELVKTPIIDAFFSTIDDTILTTIDLYDFVVDNSLGTHSATNSESRPMTKGETSHKMVVLPLFHHHDDYSPQNTRWGNDFSAWSNDTAVRHHDMDRRTKEFMGTMALIEGAIIDPRFANNPLQIMDTNTKPVVTVTNPNFWTMIDKLSTEADKIRASGETVYFVCESATITKLRAAMNTVATIAPLSLADVLKSIGIVLIDVSSGYQDPDSLVQTGYLAPLQAFIANPRLLQSKMVYGGLVNYGNPTSMVKSRLITYYEQTSTVFEMKFATCRAPVLLGLNKGQTLLDFQ